MASGRHRPLRRAAALAALLCATAIAVPSLRSWLLRSFVQVTHTAVRTERVSQMREAPGQQMQGTEVSG